MSNSKFVIVEDVVDSRIKLVKDRETGYINVRLAIESIDAIYLKTYPIEVLSYICSKDNDSQMRAICRMNKLRSYEDLIIKLPSIDNPNQNEWYVHEDAFYAFMIYAYDEYGMLMLTRMARF